MNKNKLIYLHKKASQTAVTEKTPYNIKDYKANGEQLGVDLLRCVGMLRNYAKQSARMTPEQLTQRKQYITDQVKNIANKLNVKLTKPNGSLNNILDDIKSDVRDNYLSSLISFGSHKNYRRMITNAIPVVEKYLKSPSGGKLLQEVKNEFVGNKEQKDVQKTLKPIMSMLNK